MLKIVDLRTKTMNKIIKEFGKDWLIDDEKTFPELVSIEIHPAVDVHLHYDHLTLEFRDKYFDIEKDEFSTLIYS